MKKPKNPLILHFHIFKNAGTTIDWALENFFSTHFLKFDDHTDPTRIIPFKTIINYLNDKNAKALSSHQIRFPIQNNTQFHFIPLVFIRHPIDRAFSIYHFKRRETRYTPSVLKARTLTLREFVNWSLEGDVYKEMINFQTRFLSRQDNFTEIKEEDLNIAIRRINYCTILGLVERMDESLTCAENILRPFFDNIDLSYISQNVTENRIKDMSKRLDAARKKIGINLMNRLIESNKLDIQLYSYANDELNNRIKKIPDFKNKLLDFKKRCKKLGTIHSITT